MNAAIHFFSGTGNSKRASEIIKNKLLSCQYEVNLISIEKVQEFSSDKYDLSIFVFPVYACAMPNIMRVYINKLHKVDGTQASIIAIHGETDAKHTIPGYEGQSINEAMRLLIKKGYDVFLTGKAGYPFNMSMIFNTPDYAQQEEIFKAGDFEIGKLADKLVHREKSIRKCGLLNMIWSKIFGLVYTLGGRRLLGKMYIADNKCTACGQCEKACPSGTIKIIRAFPRWNFNCEGCQRCINICPNKSIQTSLIRMATFTIITFIPFNSLVSRYIFSFTVMNNYLLSLIVNFLIWIISFVITVYLIDKVLFGFERLPIINKLFKINFTKYFRRYLEPDFKPMGK